MASNRKYLIFFLQSQLQQKRWKKFLGQIGFSVSQEAVYKALTYVIRWWRVCCFKRFRPSTYRQNRGDPLRKFDAFI